LRERFTRSSFFVSRFARQGAHGSFLDVFLPRVRTRDFFLSSLLDCRYLTVRPVCCTRRRAACFTRSLTALLWAPKAVSGTWVAHRDPCHHEQIRDSAQRCSKHETVEAAQAAGNLVGELRGKVFHAFLLAVKVLY